MQFLLLHELDTSKGGGSAACVVIRGSNNNHQGNISIRVIFLIHVLVNKFIKWSTIYNF